MKKTKGFVDYLPSEEDLVMFGARIPKGKRDDLLRRMKSLDIKNSQILLVAMIDKFLDDTKKSKRRAS